MNNRNNSKAIGSKTLDALRSITLINARRAGFVLMMLAGLTLVTPALAQTVSVTLSSPQSGMVLSPSDPVEWTLSVDVSAGDNDGLAFICADLVQASSNPAFMDIPHADEVPAAMLQFASPLGVSNPPDDGMTNGYVGTQVGPVGARNLLQIGGGQTLFGYALPTDVGLAQTASTKAGVGQNGSVIVATGSFAAPSTGGSYRFELSNVLANVLSEANQPPNISLAQAALVDASAASFSVTVIGDACNPFDTNCDGNVNGLDVQNIIAAVLDPAANRCSSCSSDTNLNEVVDLFDVQAFVAELLQN